MSGPQGEPGIPPSAVVSARDPGSTAPPPPAHGVTAAAGPVPEGVRPASGEHRAPMTSHADLRLSLEPRFVAVTGSTISHPQQALSPVSATGSQVHGPVIAGA